MDINNLTENVLRRMPANLTQIDKQDTFICNQANCLHLTRNTGLEIVKLER